MKKILSLAIILTLLISSSYHAIRAKEATAPAEANINEVTENIRERLQETIGGESISPARLYGYVGVVKDIIKNTIVIEDKDGKKNVMIEDGAKITRAPGNADIKIDSVRIDDNIIAIGSLKGEEVVGKKLIVSTESFAPPKKVSGVGIIEKIGKTNLSVTAASGSSTLDVTSKTVVKSGKGVMEYADLKIGDSVVYAATDNKGDLTATVLYLFKSAN